MAFGRLERPRASSPISDINMTPLIDVMLVLLVIFMVTAPLMASSDKLNLPKSEAATPAASQRALAVTLMADGRLQLDGLDVAREELPLRLAEAARRDPQTELHLRADQSVPYGSVAELIGAAQKAGLSRVGFATEPGSAPDPSRAPQPAANPVGPRPASATKPAS